MLRIHSFHAVELPQTELERLKNLSLDTGKPHRLEQRFFAGLSLRLSSKLLNFGTKLASDESSMYAESKHLKFITFKQTFIITKFAIKNVTEFSM